MQDNASILSQFEADEICVGCGKPSKGGGEGVVLYYVHYILLSAKAMMFARAK